LCATALAYAGALRGEFHFDDLRGIQENGAIKNLAGYLAGPFWRGFLGDGRPLTDLTFAIDYRLGGLSLLQFHLTSLACHLAAVCLVFAAARRALAAVSPGASPWAAGFCAALFGLHPLQTEAVSYLAQRSEVLASALGLGTLLLLLRAEEARNAVRAGAATTGALALFTLAMSAKPVAVTIPAAWLLWRACLGELGGAPSTVSAWRRRILVVAPFLAVAALFAWTQLRSVGPARQDAGFAIPGLGPAAYLLTQAHAVTGYLRLLVVPAGQTLEHGLTAKTLDGETALRGTLLLGLIGLSITAILRPARDGRQPWGRLASFGFLWFFLLLGPTSTILPLADVMVEHRVYLASFGIFLALSGSAVAASRAGPLAARSVVAAALGLLAIEGGLTLARNRVWRTDEALWRDVVEKTPSKSRGHMNLAHALEVEERYTEALPEYEAALALSADGFVNVHEVLRNEAATLIQLNRLSEAMAVLQRALILAPDDPDLENNLAICLLEQGDPAGARRHAERALAARPDHGPSHNTLGEAFEQLGELRAALAEFEAATAIDPDVPSRVFNLALIEERLGLSSRACHSWTRYGRLVPADAATARTHLTALRCAG
jgi:tetratricopeptide (TPR) repeat protein